VCNAQPKDEALLLSTYMYMYCYRPVHVHVPRYYVVVHVVRRQTVAIRVALHQCSAIMSDVNGCLAWPSVPY